MLRHPVLKKLWRARRAEARLLSYDSSAVLTTGGPTRWRRRARHDGAAQPEALERGPIIVCLDTSGSMRGAPETIAKAVVLAGAAHRPRRAARLPADRLRRARRTRRARAGRHGEAGRRPGRRCWR
jgi:uncharacterized protein with von Willebrand factor type A (vWA) domain